MIDNNLRVGIDLVFCNFPCIYLRSRKNKGVKPYSTLETFSNIPEITPWFITGFTDAEGSFMLNLWKRSQFSTGWQVLASFSIKLHAKDLPLLEAIQAYFGGIGSIKKGEKNTFMYTVSSIKDIAVIIAHFSDYPLITQKRADFELFKRAVTIIQRGDHLTLEGLQEIVNLRASLNKGLTDVLKTSFPETISVSRPLVENNVIPHPYWMAGFVSGEGCFFIDILKSTSSKVDIK